MKIMQAITDYIAKSVLTTQGDMVMRGVSVPEKLVAPSVNQWLRSTGVGSKPAWTINLGGASVEGDLIVRGSAICERIPAAVIGKVLKSAGTVEKPVWGIPFILGAAMATGIYTFDSSADEIVSGLGFKPGLVFFTVTEDSQEHGGWSIGFDNGTIHMTLYSATDTGNMWNNTDNSISCRRTVDNTLVGSITAIGADGFTVTHVLTGICDAKVVWWAIG